MTIRCRKVLEEERGKKLNIVNYGQGGAAAAKVATLIRQTRKVCAFVYVLNSRRGAKFLCLYLNQPR